MSLTHKPYGGYKMKKKLVAGLAVVVMMFGMAELAQATITTFDGLAGSPMPGMNKWGGFDTNITSTTDGFIFSSSGQYGHYFLNSPATDNTIVAYDATGYLMADTSLLVSKVGASAFNLSSLDLTGYKDTSANLSFTVTGNLLGGGTVSSVLTTNAVTNLLDTDGNDFQTFSLSGFTNITSFTILGSGTGPNDPNRYIAMDNMNTSPTPTPVPAAIFLLGSGLIGLMGARRQKKA